MGRVVSYNEDVPRCTFCGKTEHQARKLVAGPNASICDECIALCVDIISEERVKDAEVNSTLVTAIQPSIPYGSSVRRTPSAHYP